LRNNSPDGWTRQIDLRVAVNDPAFWLTQAKALEVALRFLTGDIWCIEFVGGGTQPPIPTRRTKRHLQGDCVCLLSGGADSLVGAIDAVAEGRSPVVVSQIAAGDKSTQRSFAKALRLAGSHLQLSHAIKVPGVSERSQRARSIVFLAYGLLAAMQLVERDHGKAKVLLVPENGFISLNIPLTPLRRGSLSTRTTHPFFICQIQRIFDACGFPVQIENPYQLKTKGEMFTECANKPLLRKLLSLSTSCGRYGRYGFSHCGRCIPCLVRRAAFKHARIKDGTTYHFDDLTIDDGQHRNFDDVQAARFAIAYVGQHGVAQWAGNSVSSAQLGPTQAYLQVANRGVRELRSLFRHMGI
jgi:7-cyano-7-deazaguanine synthase in queuosine biosynthesis